MIVKTTVKARSETWARRMTADSLPELAWSVGAEEEVVDGVDNGVYASSGAGGVRSRLITSMGPSKKRSLSSSKKVPNCARTIA